MTRELSVMGPQLKRRLEVRRVKAYIFAKVASVVGLVTAAGGLSGPRAIHDALSNPSEPLFWLFAVLSSVTLICAVVALYFLFTEEPKEVVVLEQQDMISVALAYLRSRKTRK